MVNVVKETAEEIVVRHALTRRGAWIGAVSGLALSLLLRVAKGAPPHFLAKTAMIIVIVAGFGAFVGVLVAAYRRAQRTS
jgi:protein-S-isoprenylcysteine O-methyltransferase Ste14